ncbi:MAG TPA: thymidine phosphorylase, partial [Thermofilaceae archaeon]|nr:thymidine phosphorylase [Thermofilaceae archaeon]
IVWGGALGLAPADDMIIRVEYPLGVDPFYLPSILAKKVAVGSTHVVLDIPTGRGTKVKSVVEARDIAREFMDLASMLGLRMEAVVTYGDEPIGRAVGPALEAREALETLMGRGTPDLVNKAVGLAGVLLDMIGAGGRNAALEALRSGRALRKMREIIEEQGGDPNVRPEDLPVGDKRLTVRAEEDGYVMFIDNSLVARIGRLAGAPRDKGAGVMLYVKVGDRVRRGDPLFTVYAESGARLQAVEKLLEEALPVSVGRGAAARMLLERVLPKPKTITLLER